MPTKGNPPMMISAMDTSGGATAFRTNRFNPMGGVIVPNYKLTIMMEQNHRGSMCRALTTGMKKGIVIKHIEPASIRQPMIITINCIAIITDQGDSSMDLIHETKDGVMPTKVTQRANNVAPITIMKSTAVYWAVMDKVLVICIALNFP